MNRKFRCSSAAFVALFAATIFLAGCGGSSSGPGNTPTGSTVNVSLALSPSSMGALEDASPSASSPRTPLVDIDQVWLTVTGVALIPGEKCGESPGFEDAREGEGPSEHGILRADVEPMTVDLLDLSSGWMRSNGAAARLLNAFGNVPAGTYRKLRLYYKDPRFHTIGAPDNTPLHPTAHGHLDIRFAGGDLVIPVATDTAGVRFHDVTIQFVLGREGLKITRAGGKYVMRPQVFASVTGVEYVVSGSVSGYDAQAGAFDLTTAALRAFPVQYDVYTGWFFREGARWLRVAPFSGIAAMRDGAAVDVLGNFSPYDPHLLGANDILISFPDLETGTVFGAGFLPDGTFLLDNGTRIIVVAPMPDRATSCYDGLGEAGIAGGTGVTARGYMNPDGSLSAFWITVFSGSGGTI